MADQHQTTLYDVVAVNIKTGEHRVPVPSKSYADADAAMMMAIARRGLDTEFYKVLPHGSVKEAA